jgi:hypothetical protein
MTNKMPTSLRHWEITREKGALKFVLQDGVLKWGLLMFVVTLNMPGQRFPIFVRACVWAAAGAVMGAFIWITSERQYKKFIAEKTDAAEA